MSFWHRDHRVLWHGIAGVPTPSLRACRADNLLDALLADFAPVFAEPQGLPPARACDHHITLVQGA